MKAYAVSKKHIIFVAVVMILALTVGMALVSCSSGESAEDAIRSDITDQLDPIKNLDQDVVDELTSALEELDLDDYGLTTDEYLSSLLDGFDYSIDSITVSDDESTATASVTITCKSFSDATSLASELSEDFVENNDIDDMSDDEYKAEIGEILMQALDETEATSTTCEFSYTQTDGTWAMTSDTEDEIYNAFFA